MVAIAVRDHPSSAWVDMEVGIGDIGHIVRMLLAARDEARAALDEQFFATRGEEES